MDDVMLLLCGYSYHTKEASYLKDREGLSYYLFRLQTEGYCQALVNGTLTTLVPGDLLLYKPGDRYELVFTPTPNDLGESLVFSGDYFLSCAGRWIDDWWKRGTKQQRTRINLDEKLIALWRHLVLEKRKFRMGENNGELIGHLLQALCLCIERAVLETAVPHGRSFAAARMKTFVQEKAMFAFKIEDVAQYAGLSISRSVHLFKECYGISIMEYAKEVRMAAAVERIKYSQMPLEQIAEASGFASYSFFYRVFREKYGMSPLEYRKQVH